MVVPAVRRLQLASFGAVAIVAGVVALLLAVRLSFRIETTIAVLQVGSPFGGMQRNLTQPG